MCLLFTISSTKIYKTLFTFTISRYVMNYVHVKHTYVCFWLIASYVLKNAFCTFAHFVSFNVLENKRHVSLFIYLFLSAD